MGQDSRQIDMFESASGFFLLVVLAIVLLTSFIGDFPIFLVVVGFFPVIFTIIIALVLHERHITRTGVVWLLPIIIILAFYLLGTSSPTISGTMDVNILTGVNFILALLYVLLISSIMKVETGHHNINVTKEIVEKHEESIEDYIHSIEDKSKALNFAVGRVYNKYHGGSDEIREKLRIPKEWYNEFSISGVGTDRLDVEKLMDIITQFEIRLKVYKRTEKEVFGAKVSSLKNLIRDPDGKDKIIEVMDHNDKDPVRSYYEGAVMFCAKVKSAIENEELQLVKNEYIPKTEEEAKEIKEKNTPSKSQAIKKKAKEVKKKVTEITDGKEDKKPKNKFASVDE